MGLILLGLFVCVLSGTTPSPTTWARRRTARPAADPCWPTTRAPPRTAPTPPVSSPPNTTLEGWWGGMVYYCYLKLRAPGPLKLKTKSKARPIISVSVSGSTYGRVIQVNNLWTSLLLWPWHRVTLKCDYMWLHVVLCEERAGCFISTREWL